MREAWLQVKLITSSLIPRWIAARTYLIGWSFHVRPEGYRWVQPWILPLLSAARGSIFQILIVFK